ncbi:MAG: hypothetical protein ACFE8N_09350 [Promethearchaeota archaeon]
MSIKIKKEKIFAIGMFSLTFALLLNRFAGQGLIIDFFNGLFTGLSMAVNLSFLIRYRLDKNQQQEV